MNSEAKKQNKCVLTKAFFSVACSVLFMTVLCGCVTTQRQAATDTRMRADLLVLREDIVRVQGRAEGLDMEYQRMLGEIEQLKNTTSRLLGETGNVARRLGQLERELAEQKAARVKDRELIIEELGAKMSDVLARSSATAGRPRSSHGATGYEHIVQAGETLSEIAAAYKVRVGVIIEANDLKNPDLLKQGQRLFIPQ